MRYLNLLRGENNNLLVVHVIPSGQQDTIDADINRQIIGISFIITIHSPNHTLASPNQKAGRSVDVIRPTRKGLFPHRNYWKNPRMEVNNYTLMNDL